MKLEKHFESFSWQQKTIPNLRFQINFDVNLNDVLLQLELNPAKSIILEQKLIIEKLSK